MTVEIAILNKEAVAIAADSAVTSIIPNEGGRRGLSPPKIFTSAQKIFSLSKYAPVAVMIYGGSKFANIPWEIVIKVYRNQLQDKKFDTLEEYTKDFIKFLGIYDAFLDENEQILLVSNYIYLYFNILNREFRGKVEKEIEDKDGISEERASEVLSAIISDQYEYWSAVDTSSIIADDSKKVVNKYKEIIERAKSDIFEKIRFSKDDYKKG